MRDKIALGTIERTIESTIEKTTGATIVEAVSIGKLEENAMSTATEILVPVDGSDNSQRAVRYALDLAEPLGARIRLFYVFPVSSVELIGMAGMSRDDIEHAAQAAAQRVFDKLHAQIGETGVKLDDETSIGDPAEEIIRCTEDDHDLLVILGRRGLSRIQSLLLGSVSEKVVRHARSPVMMII